MWEMRNWEKEKYTNKENGVSNVKDKNIKHDKSRNIKVLDIVG